MMVLHVVVAFRPGHPEVSPPGCAKTPPFNRACPAILRTLYGKLPLTGFGKVGILPLRGFFGIVARSRPDHPTRTELRNADEAKHSTIRQIIFSIKFVLRPEA